MVKGSEIWNLIQFPLTSRVYVDWNHVSIRDWDTVWTPQIQCYSALFRKSRGPVSGFINVCRDTAFSAPPIFSPVFTKRASDYGRSTQSRRITQVEGTSKKAARGKLLKGLWWMQQTASCRYVAHWESLIIDYSNRKGKCDGSRPICKKCDFTGREVRCHLFLSAAWSPTSVSAHGSKLTHVCTKVHNSSRAIASLLKISENS